MDANKGFRITNIISDLQAKAAKAIRALPEDTLKGFSEKDLCSANYIDGGEMPYLSIHAPTSHSETFVVRPPENSTKIRHNGIVSTFTHEGLKYNVYFGRR